MILIGTDDGIYRWFDGQGWPVFHGLQGRSLVALAAAGGGAIAALDRSGTVLETTDNGLNWRDIPPPLGTGRSTTMALLGPAGVVMAVKPLGLYRRALGAAVPKAPPSGGRGFGSKVAGTGRELAGRASALLAPGRPRAAADPDAVRLAGWTPTNAPSPPRVGVGPELRALEAVPGGWLAAVTGAGVWKTVDGGRSWSPCQGLPAEAFAFRTVPGRPGHVWAATDDGCWLSTDAGASWEARGGGLDDARQVRAVEVKPGAPDTLLVGAAPRSSAETASRGGLNFALYESTNGGKTWSHVRRSFPDRFESDTIADIRYDPAAPDNAVVALGSGELWHTTNDGAYWAPLARQIKAARCLAATA